MDANLGQVLIKYYLPLITVIEVITIQSTRTARILGKISCMTIEIRNVFDESSQD